MVFCRYEAARESEKIETSFHPDVHTRPDESKWTDIFDRRLPEIENRWRTLASAEAETILVRVQDWLLDGATIQDLFQALELAQILISADESYTLRFSTSALLKHHDLGLEFNRSDKLKKVEIEG